jgi:signal transduction histidine kinase
VETWFGKAYPDPSYRASIDRSWEEAVRTAARSGGLIAPQEYRVTCRDGSERTMMISGVPVGENQLVTLVDVTSDHELQAQLALASRLAAMGTLVAGVAHEINNPLAAEISGQVLALDVAREARERFRAGTPVDPDAAIRELDSAIEALEDAQEGGRRIERIVKDLAAFARPDPRRSLVRLADAVDDAMRWLPSSFAASASIRVEDRGAPSVMAAAGQIEQVVVNLVSNAAKAVPAGRHGEIVVRIGPGSQGTARLEVVDDGVGIPPEIVGHVFEPFFTTRSVGDGRGTGLGLAICHAIATSHGGTLTVESAVGKGSTFRMELPAVPSRV